MHPIAISAGTTWCCQQMVTRHNSHMCVWYLFADWLLLHRIRLNWVHLDVHTSWASAWLVQLGNSFIHQYGCSGPTPWWPSQQPSNSDRFCWPGNHSCYSGHMSCRHIRSWSESLLGIWWYQVVWLSHTSTRITWFLLRDSWFDHCLTRSCRSVGLLLLVQHANCTSHDCCASEHCPSTCSVVPSYTRPHPYAHPGWRRHRPWYCLRAWYHGTRPIRWCCCCAGS